MPADADLDTLRRMRAARDEIDRRFADDITVAEVAAHVHLSPAHFARRFRAVYGESPHRYLMTRRLERAAWALRQGACVTDACTSVGFSSLGSFSSRFREVYGLSPSDYATLDHSALVGVPPFMASRLTRRQRESGERSSRNEEATGAGAS